MKILFPHALILFLCSCASVNVPDAIIQKPISKTLILYGNGLLPSYGAAINKTAAVKEAAAVWSSTSRNFSSNLESTLNENGFSATSYENFRGDIRAQDMVGELAAKNESTSLIQVAVEHKKIGLVNGFYLNAKYFPLIWKKDKSGRSYVVVGEEFSREYELMSATKDFNSHEIPSMSAEFYEALIKSGVIKK